MDYVTFEANSKEKSSHLSLWIPTKSRFPPKYSICLIPDPESRVIPGPARHTTANSSIQGDQGTRSSPINRISIEIIGSFSIFSDAISIFIKCFHFTYESMFPIEAKSVSKSVCISEPVSFITPIPIVVPLSPSLRLAVLQLGAEIDIKQ